jgi:hypothetical protein
VGVDQEVRHDTALVGGGLVLLGLLGGIGIIFFLCGGGLRDVRSKSAAEGITATAAGAGVLLFTAVVVGMVLAARSRHTGTSVATTVLGSIAMCVLMLALGVAGIIHLFAGCFEPCGRRARPAAGPPAKAAPAPAQPQQQP